MKLEQARKLKVGDKIRIRASYDKKVTNGTITKIEKNAHTVWAEVTTRRGTVLTNQWYGNMRRVLGYPRKIIRGTDEYTKVREFMSVARRGVAAASHRGPKKPEAERPVYHYHSY